MPDKYVNGVQLIRHIPYQTTDTFTVPAHGGSVQFPNFALFYVGAQQNNHGSYFINDASGTPIYRLDYHEEKPEGIFDWRVVGDLYNLKTNTKIGTGIPIGPHSQQDVTAVGITSDEDAQHNTIYGLGYKSVMQYVDGEIKPFEMTTYEYGLQSGNILYFKTKDDYDQSVSLSILECSINTGWPFPDGEQSTLEEAMTDSSNDDPTPEKSTDTSDLDPKGGNGTETNRSDTIGTPNNTAELNNYSGLSAGFISLYSPSASQLRSLASYLWTSDFVDNVKKMFGDPMDVIIGLTQMPFTVPTGASTTVKAGFIDTGISMPRVSQQYIDFNMGSIRYGSYWGNALDFDPYTKVQIYLPFIGFRTLNTNDVINSTVSLKYRIDCLTGAVTAWVSSGSFVKYEFSGQCGASIPVTSQNYNNVINTAINIVSTVGTGIIGGVATGGLGTMASMATVNGISNVASGIASGGMKPTVQRSGGMGGASSLMGMRTPYLVFQRPKTSLPANYNSLYGYACNKYLRLGNCRGFTQVEHMHLQVAGATDDEMKEIENILHKGVFI